MRKNGVQEILKLFFLGSQQLGSCKKVRNNWSTTLLSLQYFIPLPSWYPTTLGIFSTHLQTRPAFQSLIHTGAKTTDNILKSHLTEISAAIQPECKLNQGISLPQENGERTSGAFTVSLKSQQVDLYGGRDNAMNSPNSIFFSTSVPCLRFPSLLCDTARPYD